MREAGSLIEAGFDVGLYSVDNGLNLSTNVKVAKVAPTSRARRMTFGGISAVRFALKSHAEIIHIHDPELIWAIPVLMGCGRKVVYDAHEDFPNQIVHKAYIPKRLRSLAKRAAEGLIQIASKSDLVVAATETVAKRYPESKTIVVKNFPHLPGSIDFPDPTLRPLQAIYVGGLEQGRGAQVMIDAFASSSMPAAWKLELAGRASDEYLRELSSRSGWEDTRYHGVVTPPVGKQMMARSRVGLVVLQDTPSYREALPTKMFEYMATGTPVIASDFPLWRSIIDEYDCGVLVDQTSPDEVAKAIARYAMDEELLKTHSRNGIRAVVQHLNWESEAKKLIKAYGELSGVSGS